MILLHALVAVIHAVLQSAAEALVAGFSLLLLLLVGLLAVGALIVALAGGLGLGGVRWAWHRRHPDEKNESSEIR